METGERGFLITGNSLFLEPFDNALEVWSAKISQLTELVADNKTQVERLNKIDALQQQWLTQAAEKEIAARRQVNDTEFATMEKVIQLIEAQTGKNIIDQIRQIKQQFIQAEHRLMIERQQAASQAITSAKRVVLFGGASAVILAIFITLYITTQLVRNLNILVHSTEQISAGDFDHKVLVSSQDEFSLLATSFNRMTISLKQSIEKMESAVQVKTDFLANMSHEIRTPMNGILGMLTLLEETHLNKQQLEYIESIRSCGDGLLVVINDILDISKLEAGKLALEQQSFDLSAVINESCFLLDSLASQKGLTISILIDKNIPDYLVGDRLRIRQVLLNLLSNAIKFSNQGDVQLILTIDSMTDQHCNINIEIIDQGIGISADDIDKLFKPFSQVDTSTTRLYGGTGLGLIICAQLVKQMGGGVSM